MDVQLVFCVVFLKAIFAQTDFNLTVQFYERLIEEQTEEAFEYQLPNNSYDYRASTPEVSEFGTFDYIIVGAGSAGAVIATRLSEDENLRILLLEAGEHETPFSDIPGMMVYLQGLRFNWNFVSVPQTTCCLGMVNRQCPFPRGRVLGGTSTINALMYVRGNKNDYDSWERLGNPGWSYKDVLPYFIKSENSQIDGDRGYHGKEGFLNVDHHRPNSPTFQAFIDANLELGRRYVDYNGREQLGVAATQLNVLNGRRHSTGRAFLSRAARRPNLKILTDSLVTKVLISESRREAYGVEFSHHRRSYVARASKEVILSAGSLGSPHLLMLSGIGPAEHLRQHGIPVIRDLAVGQNMQDHATFYGLFVTVNYSEPVVSTAENVEAFLRDFGPLTIPGNSQALGFFHSNLSSVPGVPDIETILIPANATNDFIQRAYRFTNDTYNAVWGRLDPLRSFTVYIMVLHPKSRGTVRLQSADPYDYPLIDPRFLSDPEGQDIETMYRGVQLTLEMLNTAAFRRLNATLFYGPYPACQQYQYLSRAYWYCQIRQTTMNIYHPSSTCVMGPDPAKGAVVDSKLRVHGISRLRVADASIFPLINSGHTHAPAVMVGEKLADILKDRKPEKCGILQLLHG